MGHFIVRILDSVERFLTIVADWFYEEDQEKKDIEPRANHGKKII